MNAKTVTSDKFLIVAGECFMFLLWSETVMRDFVVLEDGGEDMRRRYSQVYGKDSHPRDFSRRRLEQGTRDFTDTKKQFLKYWPQWKDHGEVKDAIERIVIWRNALGHANVQPFRGSLLYTPREGSWKRIQNYARCHHCRRYLQDCDCHHEGLAEPHTIIVNDETIQTIYQDIRTVDVECFYPTAVSLNIDYLGVDWPTGDGTHVLKENHRIEDEGDEG